jgi:hypothetical protein
MIRRNLPSGRIYAGNSPGALELVTFVSAAPWRQLLPEDEAHDLFLWVWKHQPLPDHRSFWEAALKVWPRRRGQPRTSEFLAMWVSGLRRRGLADVEIAARLGYPLDNLRRMGVLRLAEDFDASSSTFDTNEPLPMVWAPEVDGPAPLMGSMPSLVALAAFTEEEHAQRNNFEHLGAPRAPLQAASTSRSSEKRASPVRS